MKLGDYNIAAIAKEIGTGERLESYIKLYQTRYLCVIGETFFISVILGGKTGYRFVLTPRKETPYNLNELDEMWEIIP